MTDRDRERRRALLIGAGIAALLGVVLLALFGIGVRRWANSRFDKGDVERADLQTQVESLSSQLDTTKAALDAANAKNDELSARLEEATTELRLLREFIASRGLMLPSSSTSSSTATAPATSSPPSASTTPPATPRTPPTTQPPQQRPRAVLCVAGVCVG